MRDEGVAGGPITTMRHRCVHLASALTPPTIFARPSPKTPQHSPSTESNLVPPIKQALNPFRRLHRWQRMFPTYIHPPLEFKLVDSQGIPCRAKFWPSKRPCQTYLLFIPGNPGIISYYDEFLSTLHEHSPSTTILGISLAGHEDFELRKPLSLHEQILNKVRILDSITTSATFTSLKGDKPKLVVMGHSVGAYMALQALRLRPNLVDNVFLLFPTLSHISKGSTFGRVSSVMTSLPGAARIAALIVFLIRFIFPIPLLALFVKIAHALPGNSLQTTLAKLLNPGSIESFCHLAKYEFRDIRELDADTLTKYAKRVSAYYAVQDRWVPSFGREEAMRIITENGGDAHLCSEGFPHSFSLVHGPQMAKKIVLWISTLHHPVAKSPSITRSPVPPKQDDGWADNGDEKSEYSSTFPWTWSDQDAETLVNASPDASRNLTRNPIRKESLGGGVIVREKLIRDLE